MSLSQKSLSSIQKAGQATHSAAQAIAASVQTQAQGMVASVAAQPFGSESEHALNRFKMLARLNQGLASVEGQLRELFAIATELAGPASDVVIALPYAAKLDSSNIAAVDVIAKSPKAAKSAKKKLKSKRISKKVTTSSGALTANDTTLLQYLQSVLKTGEEARITGNAMAAGSGLPLGSVGLSLKKILSSGAVTSSARGQYQLGGTSQAAAPAPEAKRNAKKVKVAPAKKAKSAAQPQDSVSATKEAAS